MPFEAEQTRADFGLARLKAVRLSYKNIQNTLSEHSCKHNYKHNVKSGQSRADFGLARFKAATICLGEKKAKGGTAPDNSMVSGCKSGVNQV